MAIKQTRLERGRRRARSQLARCLTEIRIAREVATLSQQAVAEAIGMSQPSYWRFERGRSAGVTVERLAEVASVLGLEVSVQLYPVGDPIRDRGQLHVGKRFEQMLSDVWEVTDEHLLPGPGEQRAWDKLLRLSGAAPVYRVGVDIETRATDIQALVRRTRGRERDGQVDAILIVLSDSAHNRRIADELRAALGPQYATGPRILTRALRSGQRLVGSGVVLV